MKKRNVLLASLTIIVVVAIAFVYNNSKMPNESESIRTYLSSVKAGAGFDLSKARETDDSVYVIKPYDRDFFSLNGWIKADSDDKDRMISTVSANDGICLLLFVKDGKAVAYAEIPRTVADFASIGQNGFPIKTALLIDKHRIVHIR